MPVDIRELAIERDSGISPLNSHLSPLTSRLWTRYAFPLVLICGFFSLVVWASQDMLFPRKLVTVVPVYSTTAEVRQEGTPLFKAAGWIEPRPTPIRVAALAPGVVEKLLVVEDQPVVRGEPIAELVKADAGLVHDRALADLELRQAELEEARVTLTAATTRFQQPVHLEAALGEADATLAKIATQLTNLPFEIRRAEADYEARKKDHAGKLAAQGVVAGVEVDIAKSKEDSTGAFVEELRDRTESLQKEQRALSQRRDAMKTQLELLADETKDKGEAQARIHAAQARVTQARIAVAEAKLQLTRMTVVAPVDGRVYRLIAHPGARIGSGMTQMTGYDGSTVITMYQPEMLQVRVDVRFEDLPKISLQQRVDIDNPALTSPLTGKVLFISSEADIQKNTLQVKVELPNPPPVFKPEMLVDVTFLSPSPESRVESPEVEGRSQEVARIFVPPQLIQSDNGETFVWLADQSEGIARKTVIQTGTSGGNGLVEVTSGLTISNRIIASGTDKLTDGCRIQITGEDPTIGTIPPELAP